MTKSVWTIKIRRIVFSFGGDLFVFLTMIASLIIGLYTTTRVHTSMLNWILFLLTLAGAIFLGKQWYVKYMEITYDPTWALKFQDRFNSNDMLKKRAAAAQCIIVNEDKLAEIDQIGDKLCMIDWVLFYLEDIGFYVDGIKISPEVAYHHFYYWIRGYYLWTHPYIKAWQKKAHEKSRWEHIEKLYIITSEIATKNGESSVLSKKELIEFIKKEIRLPESEQDLICPV